MQKFFALIVVLFLPIFIFAFSISDKPTSFVSDFASVFSDDQKGLLENKISEFERNTGNEIAIVTIKSLDGDTVENVAQSIFDKWKIGKKGKDNGLLILIAVSDREMRIQTGYGLESFLPDLLTYKIQTDIMIPEFKEGKFFEGTSFAVDEVINILSGKESTVSVERKNNNDSEYVDGMIGDSQIYIFLSLMIFLRVISVLGRSKSWWLGGVFGGVLGVGLSIFFSLAILTSSIVTLLFIILGLRAGFLASKKGGGSGGGFGGFGGGGFSSGGGFGGFGGGSSGGGGSSSRW